MVLWKSARPFSARSRPRAAPWPKALSVARPWSESRNSAPNAAYAFWRARLARLSCRCQAAGAISVTSAATSRTRAIGRSTNATKAKMSTGVSTATASCGRY